VIAEPPPASRRVGIDVRTPNADTTGGESVRRGRAWTGYHAGAPRSAPNAARPPTARPHRSRPPPRAARAEVPAGRGHRGEVRTRTPSPWPSLSRSVHRGATVDVLGQSPGQIQRLQSQLHSGREPRRGFVGQHT